MAEALANDWWDQLMMKTGRKMAACFDDNNLGFVDALVVTSGTRHFMVWLYKHMVVKKRIPAIETLDTDSKKEIWSFIKEVCTGKTNNVIVMKEIAMAFQAIEYFINEKN